MSKMAKAATWLMLATLLAKILGFGREIALSYVYGTNAYTEAFVMAFNIPTIIFAAIGSAIATTYIPIFFEVRGESGEDGALKLTNNIFNTVIIICGTIATIGVLFTEPLVKLFAMGFEGERLRLTVEFTRILIVSVIFIGLSYVMTAYLQVHNNFTVPGLISIPKNIIIIISIFLSAKYHPLIIAIGTFIGIATEFLIQVPFAYKKGYRYKLHIDLRDDKIKKLIMLIGPIFIGIAVNQINTMIDRTLASTLPYGTVGALNFASKLNGFVIGLFIVSISAVAYPMISKLSAENSSKDFSKVIVKSVNSIILLVLPVSVGAIVLCTPIVRLLFERGEFTKADTIMTASALAFYSIGLIGSGLSDMLTKILYSLKDTKTPMIVAIIAVLVNIVLNLVFIKILKHSGLALATSISNLSVMVMLFIALKKKISYFGQDKIIIVFIKSLIASILMGGVVYISNLYLGNALGYGLLEQVIALGISVLIGVIIYGGIIIVFKVEEITIVIDLVKQKLKARGGK